MANLDKAAILQKINTLLADNTAENISASDVREILTDIKDSFANLIDNPLPNVLTTVISGLIPENTPITDGISILTALGYTQGQINAIASLIGVIPNLQQVALEGNTTTGAITALGFDIYDGANSIYWRIAETDGGITIYDRDNADAIFTVQNVGVLSFGLGNQQVTLNCGVNTNPTPREYILPDKSGILALSEDVNTLTGAQGITREGQEFKLGGTVFEDADFKSSIQVDTQGNIIFNTENKKDLWSGYLKLSAVSGGMYLGSENAGVRYGFGISGEENFYFSVVDKILNTQKNYLLDVLGGLVADADYSADYSPRSLVDKGYVDSRLPAVPFFKDDFIFTPLINGSFWRKYSSADTLSVFSSNSTHQHNGVLFAGGMFPGGEQGAVSSNTLRVFCFEDLDYVEWVMKVPVFANTEVLYMVLYEGSIQEPSSANKSIGFKMDSTNIYTCVSYANTNTIQNVVLGTQISVANEFHVFKVQKVDTMLGLALEFYIDGVRVQTTYLMSSNLLFDDGQNFGFMFYLKDEASMYVDKLELYLK